MLLLFTTSLLVTLAGASFCGDSAIPFSVEITPDGQPILGCARPSCFGWAPNGQPATISGAFFSMNERPDGFFRPGRDSIPPFANNDPRFFRPQTAICEPAPASTACSGPNQWVGGIGPALNHSTSQTLFQCCAFDGVLGSESRGVASLHPGEMALGGEVNSSDVQTSFDYISDIQKRVNDDGTVQFDVSINRMPCPDVDALSQPQVFNQEPRIFNQQPQFFNQPPPPMFNPPPVAFQAPTFVPPPVAAAPVYTPPVAFAGAGGGGGATWCFSDDMTVRLIDGSIKRMDQLSKQDWVLTAHEDGLDYEPVKFWLHRVPEQIAQFNVFETEDGKTIKLTDKHYIYKGDCARIGTGPAPLSTLPKAAVTADQLSAGDCLYTLGDCGRELHEVRIVRAGKVIQKGIYAPMTSTGRIIVNNIHASCHNIMQANAIGHSAYWMVEKANRIYESIFGTDSGDVVETPAGLSTILAISDLVMPKNVII